MRVFAITVVSAASLLCAGCIGLFPHVQKRDGRSSSLVDYLYPNGAVPPPVEERIARLNLPLRVGLAFLPDEYGYGPSATQRARTLERVREAFIGREYVSQIEVIADHYLRSARGVRGMTQLARLYDLDAVALVAFDQIAGTSERDSALLYWTLVGAYVVKGTEHRVQTMVDTAVLDAGTAKLLLRAPGFSERRDNVTLSDSRRELARSVEHDFDAAVDDMIVNLAVELDRFETRIEQSADARIEARWRPGFGGGALGPLLLLWGAVLLARRHRAS